MRPCSFAERDEHSLVIVTGKCSGFIILYQCAFAAALTAGADFQCLWRGIHHQRHIAATRSHARGQCLYAAVLQNLHSAIRWMIFQSYRRRDRPCAERGGKFFFKPDATALCRMFRTEARRLQYAWRMMCLCTEGAGHFLRHVHPAPALVVQADAACRSNAIRSTSGSSLPRTEALRRIPRHAFGLK